MFVHSVPFLKARSLNQRNIKKFFLPTSRSWTRYRLAMRQLSKPQIHRNRCLSDDWQPARTFPPNIEILFLYAHNQANLRLLFQRPESPSEAPKTPPGDEKMTKNFDSCSWCRSNDDDGRYFLSRNGKVKFKICDSLFFDLGWEHVILNLLQCLQPQNAERLLF